MAVILIGVGAALIATVSFAESPAECGTLHTVGRGDTLFKIAKQAYGDGWQYKRIFMANRDLLPDEGSVEIGDQLLIPCLDGTGLATRREAMAQGLPDAPAVQESVPITAGEESVQTPVQPKKAPTAPIVATVAATVQESPCGNLYTVVRGDTLFKIAERAYGDGSFYISIFKANRDLLPGEGSVEIGDQLLIPCLDGTGPATRREAMAPGRAELPDEHEETPAETADLRAETTEELAQDPVGLIEHASRLARRAVMPGILIVDPVRTGAEPIEVTEEVVVHVEAPLASRGEVSAAAQDPHPAEAADQPERMSEHPAQLFKQLLGTDESLRPVNAPRRTAGTLREARDRAWPTTADAAQTADPPKRMNEGARYAAAEPGEIPADSGVARQSGRAQLKLLTGSNFRPYADKDLPAGGMITDLVSRAVGSVAPDEAFHVAFVSDWSAHIDVLLPDGAFDVGFPWYKPDCSMAERLVGEMRLLCAEFDFSRPFIEVPVAFYARTGDSLVSVTDYAGLHGKRLCRPKGHFMFDLDQRDLRAPNVSIETPETALACFVKLIQGQVDVVTLVKHEVDRHIRHLDIAGQVAEIGGLASGQTLHAVVPKSNPRGRHYLNLINHGLDRLMKSGQWFDVVATHNSRQLALTN